MRRKGSEIVAKTEATLELEKAIWSATVKQGVFGCFEVTIGWFGTERVDYMTYDTKGTWRCYEIKISKADFHSKAHNTFIGHFNYYVMTKELFDEVWNEVPEEIGIYVDGFLTKRPKRQALKVDEQILKNSMIRSLCRENEKFVKTCDNKYIDRLKNQISRLENESRENQSKFVRASNAIYEICEKYKLDHREVRQFVRDCM